MTTTDERICSSITVGLLRDYPENVILLLALWLYSSVSISVMKQDVWPAVITFLLKANLLVLLKLSSLWKVWKFVQMEPHIITEYFANKEPMLVLVNFTQEKHRYTICDVWANFNWSSYRNLKSITLTLSFFFYWKVIKNNPAPEDHFLAKSKNT